MRRVGTTLRAARESARLPVETVARLLGVQADELLDIEESRATPSMALMERTATLYGVSPSALLRGEAQSSPATLLFRSAEEHRVDIGDLMRGEDLHVLGDFLVCASEVDTLKSTLGMPNAEIPSLEPEDLTEPEWQQGRDFAERTRQLLGLGDTPIPSMRSLLADRLGWEIFFVTPDVLSPSIDGASTIHPRPAILVNLLGGSASWWRTRATLAHEMCHVLVDSRQGSRPYLISPEGTLKHRGVWTLVERFRGIERRANAFAAHFLVPRRSLFSLVSGTAADSEEAIHKVCGHFGVGRQLAIRRLGHEFKLSTEVQTQMLAREADKSHCSEHADADVEIGLRRGVLRSLVRRALEADKLSPLRARAILRVPMSAPLPDAIGGGPPMVSRAHVERTQALRDELR
ncbi:MAG: helix-turn-helix domain-containing protein [Myxococcales bacterium]|nr:helix-turn-helix domain-containing protein [Myxococcales bacterium]MCB9704743.1 helix-turn-helix domain-containing protein [Myxococcales bacterium]